MRIKAFFTSIITGVIFLVAGAAPAGAQSVLGHISVSVVGALNISEVYPLKFGNLAIVCTNNQCDTASSIVLAVDGTRTAHSAGSDNIMLLNGGGVGSGSAQETGSQSP